MSLRFRINLVITVLMLLFALVTGLIVVSDARRSIREEVQAGTKVSVQLMTTVVYSAQFLPGTRTQREVMLNFLQHLGRVRANEIRMYVTGRADAVYVSPPPTYKAGRDAPAWFARLVAPPVTPATLLLQGGRIVILPDASRATLDAWDDLSHLAWIGAGFFVAANLLVFWLVGRALSPVDDVVKGMAGMAQGRFDLRLPRFALPEFAAVSDTFNRMAAALAASMAENRRLALISQQTSDAILIRDPDGRITFWNPAAERLFGYRAEEVHGRQVALLAPGEDGAAGPLAACSGVVENREIRCRTRDGRVLDVALSSAPLVDPHDGRAIGDILALRDISAGKRAAEAERELEQNRRLSQLVHAHLEQERRSLARELHDELGQCVTAIRTIGASIANRSEHGDGQIHSSARTIVAVAGDLYDAVHGLVRRLRPSTLDHWGLARTLEETVGALQSRHPDIRFGLDLQGDLEQLDETVSTTVYRIVQEALTNVVRHARATRVEAGVARGEDALLVRVTDDGRGIDAAAPSAGHFGLLGMRERVESLGGEFVLHTAPGEGVSLRIAIPLAPSPQAVTGEARAATELVGLGGLR